jgi:hypothetical protein
VLLENIDRVASSFYDKRDFIQKMQDEEISVTSDELKLNYSEIKNLLLKPPI